jgi:hypothetical protein
MAKLAPDHWLIALHATLNAAQLTVPLVIGAVGVHSNLRAVFKFAHAHALSQLTHHVAEPSAHLSLTMTPRPLAVLLTVLWTNGAHGLSAHRALRMAILPNNKQEVARSSFKLHAVAKIAPPTSPKLSNAPPTYAIEIVRFPTGHLLVPAMLAVVMVTRSELAL